MPTTMLNVRIDKNLKREGDSVLAKQGISIAEAIRGLYRYMEETREVPDCCRQESAPITSEDRRRKMHDLVGIAKLSSGEDLDSLKQHRLARLEF